MDLGGDGGETQQQTPQVASIDPPALTGEEDLAEFESAPIVHLASKNFQKSTVWFMLIAAFCSFRAASAFTVSVAYICVGFRLV